jgi:hypothetical protein
MKKTRPNNKENEISWESNKNIAMPTRNGKIATNNSRSITKMHWQYLEGC